MHRRTWNALGVAGAGVNIAVGGWIGWKAIQGLRGALRERDLLREFVDAVHRALHGVEGGNPNPLGEPDALGVYKRAMACGATLYIRRAAPAAPSHAWEFSLDGMRWLPAQLAEYLLASSDGVPRVAERLLMLRLELESRLAPPSQQQAGAGCKAGKQPGCELPPLSEASDMGDGALRAALNLPPPFVCPLGMQLMTDPVVTPSGMSYERSTLAAWVAARKTDPATGHAMSMEQALPNVALRDLIQAWLVQPGGSGPSTPGGASWSSSPRSINDGGRGGDQQEARSGRPACSQAVQEPEEPAAQQLACVPATAAALQLASVLAH